MDHLEAVGQTFTPWQEAAEREVSLPSLQSADLLNNETFQFPSGRELEPLRSENEIIVGVVIREWKSLSGSVEVDAEPQQNGVIKITVSIKTLLLSSRLKAAPMLCCIRSSPRILS